MVDTGKTNKNSVYKSFIHRKFLKKVLNFWRTIISGEHYFKRSNLKEYY